MSALTLAYAIEVAARHFALNPAETIHGPKHWTVVIHNALNLAEREGVHKFGDLFKRGSPSEFLLWFSVLHDCCRNSENADPEHGERAAQLVDGLVRDGTIQLSWSMGPDDLAYAIARHNTGRVSHRPLIGICWDADRLDLPRCGITPYEELMSTKSGKAAAMAYARTKPPARIL